MYFANPHPTQPFGFGVRTLSPILLPGHVALDDPALDVVAPLRHHLPARGVGEVALRSVGGVVRHDGEHDHVEGEHHEDHAEAHQEQRLREEKLLLNRL